MTTSAKRRGAARSSLRPKAASLPRTCTSVGFAQQQPGTPRWTCGTAPRSANGEPPRLSESLRTRVLSNLNFKLTLKCNFKFRRGPTDLDSLSEPEHVRGSCALPQRPPHLVLLFLCRRHERTSQLSQALDEHSEKQCAFRVRWPSIQPRTPNWQRGARSCAALTSRVRFHTVPWLCTASGPAYGKLPPPDADRPCGRDSNV
jgi:hypothetical protein